MIVSPEEERLYLRKVDRRLRELKERVYADLTPIEDIRIRLTRRCEPAAEAVKAPGFRKVRVGRRWGNPWQTAWFLFTFTVPKKLTGRPVLALLEPGGEAVAFLDGQPLHGLDANRSEILLPQGVVPRGRPLTLAVEAGANDAFGRFREPRVLSRADLATVIPEMRAYWYDASVLVELAKELPADSTRRAQIIEVVNQSVDVFDYDEHDPETLAVLAAQAWKVLEPVLRRPSSASEQHFVMQGHAHIDVAWLWPLWETVRKCARTFSTVDALMDEFPDYVFGQSQAQLYAYTKEHYPELYERIRRRIAEGRWEVTGGTWVEMDCNIPSGESLIRQAIYGRRFFREEFGVEPEIAWLPDVFGYPACLPQIFMKSGLRYFLTQKMSWNQFDRIPYNTFRWRGIDGTEILTHFPPTNTYNGRLTPQQMLEGARNFSQKGICREQLYLFGFGDGGGGPTRQMLEYAKRTKSLEGLPSSEQGRAHGFFARATEECQRLPVWDDELYGEFHRGTYTTQARTKRNNRKAELLYREAELWSAVATNLRVWPGRSRPAGAQEHAGRPGWSFPTTEMRRGWELILLNQFHDVLPGSSIAEVYKDSARQYEEVLAIGERSRCGALTALAKHVDTGELERPFAVFNSLSWARTGVVSIDAPRGRGPYEVVTSAGEAVPTQLVRTGRKRQLLFQAPDVPSMGYATFDVRRGTSQMAGASDLRVSTRKLENGSLRVRLNGAGHITSIYDKRARREVLSPGARGNQLQLFEDKPVANDGWDVDLFYEDKPPRILKATSVRVTAKGPEKASLRMTYGTRAGSAVVQEVALYAGQAMVVFNTQVDWHETDKMLKAAFPVAVRSRRATYEIQFGHVDRPTHRTTSWDRAKFEVPAHRWADLSEGGYGVALVNDCKYGYDIKDSCMRLTLLRAPTSPDPTADRGQHEFAYALYPHQARGLSPLPGQTGVVRRGYEFNVPLAAKALPTGAGKLGPSYSFFSLSVDHVVLDTVKPAEDGEGIILRLYEAHGGRGPVRLDFGLEVREVRECDCLERSVRSVEIRGNGFTFDVTPFEIKTFRLLFG